MSFNHIGDRSTLVKECEKWRIRPTAAGHFQALLTATVARQPVVNQGDTFCWAIVLKCCHDFKTLLVLTVSVKVSRGLEDMTPKVDRLICSHTPKQSLISR